MRQVSEGGANREKRRRLTAYGGGMLFLAVSLWCAFALPGYYSRWQDEQLLSSIHMEDRSLALLPAEQESVVGDKMCRIRENEGYNAVSRYDLADRASVPDALVTQVWRQLTACVLEWKDFGLLPDSFMEEYEAGSLEYVSLYRLEGTELGVYWVQLYRGDAVMDFLMDWEGECLYVASIHTPEKERDWFSGEKSLREEMQEEGTFRVREYCQADYAQLEPQSQVQSGRYGTINLFYEDARAQALRGSLIAGQIYQSGQDKIVDGFGWGFAVLLGDQRLWELVAAENIDHGMVYELISY
ncbi:MAG: hypothetical protein HFI38_03725 [Lachnospiraceae bacterium]|jgi:hypothetical protein|nr:hypothetical protein [Lachnospiraceae bacterium]